MTHPYRDKLPEEKTMKPWFDRVLWANRLLWTMCFAIGLSSVMIISISFFRYIHQPYQCVEKVERLSQSVECMQDQIVIMDASQIVYCHCK